MNSEPVNIVALVLSVLLLLSAIAFVRPANGERPLLVGFMLSATFGFYLGFVRVFSLQSATRPFFGYVLCFWLLVKLWALYSARLNTPRPFLLLLRRLFGSSR